MTHCCAVGTEHHIGLAKGHHFRQYLAKAGVDTVRSPDAKGGVRVLNRRVVTALGLVGALLTLIGCTSGSRAHPAETSDAPSSSSSSSSPTTSSPAPTSGSMDPAAREAADRQAVEAAWAHYWAVYETFESKIPQGRWDSTIAQIAVDPIRAQILKAARADRIIGVVLYGQVVPHPYWQVPINGKATATIGDCQDASHAGTMFARTGQKRTVGVAHNNIRATLVRGSDGRWRVKQIEYLLDVKCG
jgi:hypothetical protein